MAVTKGGRAKVSEETKSDGVSNHLERRAAAWIEWAAGIVGYGEGDMAHEMMGELAKRLARVAGHPPPLAPAQRTSEADTTDG